MAGEQSLAGPHPALPRKAPLFHYGHRSPGDDCLAGHTPKPLAALASPAGSLPVTLSWLLMGRLRALGSVARLWG